MASLLRSTYPSSVRAPSIWLTVAPSGRLILASSSQVYISFQTVAPFGANFELKYKRLDRQLGGLLGIDRDLSVNLAGYAATIEQFLAHVTGCPRRPFN